jgi:hypothetical protein
MAWCSCPTNSSSTRRSARIPQVKQADGNVRFRRAQRHRLADQLPAQAPINSVRRSTLSTSRRSGQPSCKKHEIIPELDQLLEDNFLKYDGTGEVPSQIHSYLSTNYNDLRGLEKNRSSAGGQGQGSLVCARPEQGAGPGEEAREGAAQGIRGLSVVHRSQDQGVASGSAACWFPRCMGSQGLRRPSSASPTSCQRKRCKRTRSC